MWRDQSKGICGECDEEWDGVGRTGSGRKGISWRLASSNPVRRPALLARHALTPLDANCHARARLRCFLRDHTLTYYGYPCLLTFLRSVGTHMFFLIFYSVYLNILEYYNWTGWRVAVMDDELDDDIFFIYGRSGFVY